MPEANGVNAFAVVNVAVLAVATFLCWGFWSGKRTLRSGMRAYRESDEPEWTIVLPE